MTDRWYYGWDDRKLGPYTAQQLRDLADAGHIQPMDTVWKEGVEQGVPAHRVKNLFTPLPAGGLPGVRPPEEAFAPHAAQPQATQQAEPPRAVPETEVVINLRDVAGEG